MATENNILKAKHIIPMSEATKKRIAKVAKQLEGKELFPRKVAAAKEALSYIKSLPSS